MIILYHHYDYCSLVYYFLRIAESIQLFATRDTWMTCQGEHAAADDQETHALSPLPDFGGKRRRRSSHWENTGLSNPTP